MKHHFTPGRRHAIAAALSTMALLAACGGGDGAPATASTAAGTTKALQGVVAVGAPLVGARVDFTCVAGSPATATTSASGSYTVPAEAVSFPCVASASGGTVDGIAHGETLHAAVLASGQANVTPLTTLQLATLAGTDLAAWVPAVQADRTLLQERLTPSRMSAALATVKAQLGELSLAVPQALDPVTTPFLANGIDPADQLLDQLGARLASAGISLADAQLHAAAALPIVERTPATFTLEKIGGYQHQGGLSAAEIPAYDPLSRRLFTVNGALGTIDVIDLSNPAAPVQVATISTAAFGSGLGGANGVAVHNGVVALAIEASPKTAPGKVALVRARDLLPLGTATVGALPDMLTFTPDGLHLLVANEGEPNSYGQPDSVDPEGSVSVIALGPLSPFVNAVRLDVTQVGFSAFNGQRDALRQAGVRIFGPGANVAQDLEPEYIAVSADSRTAFVTLQENNAIATIDIASRTVTSIKSLGLKDHSLAGNGLDVSNEDAGTNTNSGAPSIKIANYPIKGMYLPDAVAAYTVDGQTYLITANEGDAREYTGVNAIGREDPRVREYCTAGLDPTVFPDAVNLLFDSNLGRLRITTFPGGDRNGKNEAGQCNELVAFGARSFSIWRSSDITQVFDSGDQFEQHLAGLHSAAFPFNASNDNGTFDDRSPAKGPEPEGVVVGRIGSKTFAFIGLERAGGVMAYDVSNPQAPVFVTYLNTRNGATGDRGPEGLQFVRAAHSPNGKPLLIVGNETSGTTAVIQLNLAY